MSIKLNAFFVYCCVWGWRVLHCVCAGSAQMEPLIEACAADHCRTHYGNFQLEEPASVRAGRAAGWARPHRSVWAWHQLLHHWDAAQLEEDNSVRPVHLSRYLVSFLKANIWQQKTFSTVNSNKFTWENREDRQSWLNYLSGQSVLKHRHHTDLYQKRDWGYKTG